MKAKEVINTSQEIVGLVGRSILDMSGAGFAGQNVSDTATFDVTDSMKHKLERLKELTHDNARATEVLNRLNIEITRFLENWRDLVGSWRPGQTQVFFAQFFY